MRGRDSEYIEPCIPLDSESNIVYSCMQCTLFYIKAMCPLQECGLDYTPLLRPQLQNLFEWNMSRVTNYNYTNTLSPGSFKNYDRRKHIW